MRKGDMTQPEDQIPEELEHLYDSEEVFKIDGTPEELADALLKS